MGPVLVTVQLLVLSRFGALPNVPVEFVHPFLSAQADLAVYEDLSNMDGSKRLYKFHAGPGEVFQLWEIRTETTLSAKKLFDVVETDPVTRDEIPEEFQSKLEEAFEIIVRGGLGDKPLRLCLTETKNPSVLFRKLKERYAVANVATRVQLLS